MDKSLLIANMAAFGILFTIWKRSDFVNAAIKLVMLALLIANIVAYMR